MSKPVIQTCNTCRNYQHASNNPSDILAGVHKKCVVDNSPANRYANPDKACRLIPMKWTKR